MNYENQVCLSYISSCFSYYICRYHHQHHHCRLFYIFLTLNKFCLISSCHGNHPGCYFLMGLMYVLKLVLQYIILSVHSLPMEIAHSPLARFALLYPTLLSLKFNKC